ncbi:MAG: hypothetical protein J6D13_06190 [Clostridium sp.]|nr:hypothetical protein [Clostridium sp.]
MQQNKKESAKTDFPEEHVIDDDVMDDDFMGGSSLCSSTDCTGLIPSLPVSDSEITSYEQLYHFLPKAKG